MLDISEIKKLRKSLGLTQKELAARAGVSQSLIAKIEGGGLDPSYGNAKRIFDALTKAAHRDIIRAEQVINRRIISVSPEAKITDVIGLMKRHAISQMPVLEEGKVIGLVTEGDLVEAIDRQKDISSLVVRDVMGEAPPVLSSRTDIGIVSGVLRQFPMVLIAERGKLKGLITKSDILEKAYK